MRSLRAAVILAAGGLVSFSLGTAHAADRGTRDASLATADATQRGQTSCEIERGGDGSDWVIRITHRRDKDGPDTSRCAIIPPKNDKPVRTAPTPSPKRGGHDERNAR